MVPKNKQSANVAMVLRKLKQLGSPVDLSVVEKEVEEAKIEIAQTGPVYGTSMFELRDGRAGYVFGVDIVNQRSRPVYCLEIEFRGSWPDPDFEWLPDPQECHRDVHHYYSFPGKGAPEFPRGQVLNHVLLSGSGVLQPRIPYEGWLLAVGGPMPKHLRHGEEVEGALVIVASDHTEYSERMLLLAERNLVKPEPRRTASSLYESPAGTPFGIDSRHIS
jgi:hypothetical protein